MSDQITVEQDTASEARSRTRTRTPNRSAPVVIEARGLSKSFRIPEQKIDTLKERATHPLNRPAYRELRVLRDISFDVHKGEFFGIVGRNGSGKSTLLKIVASIYRPDAGKVRMAGQVAPFIELGVGFNPELTARENSVLNGVLMGLTRREAQGRLDAVLDFGDLRDFVDLKIKNYSSGMMVRLAFSIMVQADADIMLIDEVLAVGDAAFGQKCMDVFYRRRDAGKTLVLVTHDMSTVQSLCDRAMVIHDGEARHVGDPEQAAMSYFRLNFGDSQPGALDPASVPAHGVSLSLNARLIDATLLNPSGGRVANVEQEQPVVLDATIEAARELTDPIFVFHIRAEDGVVVSAFTRKFEGRLAQGQRVRLKGQIENRLVPGGYAIDCWIRRDRETGAMALQSMRLVRFVVYGTAPRHGVVSLETDIEPTLEPLPDR